MQRSLFAMFPGQGSQYPGMGKALLAEFPATKTIFEEAEDAAKIPLRRLCFEGPESELKLTANTQPCILTVSVATWQVLRSEAGIEPVLYAGHSLGEYSALVAAGKLSLFTAAALVRARGEAMQRAVPEGVGGMAAVLNFDAEKLQARCTECARGDESVEIVNYNSPQQVVVAGHVKAIERLVAKLGEADKVKAVVLPVSAPFHSKLMQPARAEMEPRLREAKLEKTAARMIPNLTGTTADEYKIEFLIEQIDSPVRWTQTLDTAMKAGANTYLEIGPGRVLCGLAKRSIPKDSKLIGSDDVKAALKELNPA